MDISYQPRHFYTPSDFITIARASSELNGTACSLGASMRPSRGQSPRAPPLLCSSRGGSRSVTPANGDDERRRYGKHRNYVSGNIYRFFNCGRLNSCFKIAKSIEIREIICDSYLLFLLCYNTFRDFSKSFLVHF